MRYYVDINPAGKDLDKSSDTLALADTCGDTNRYSPELLMDTIHLYACQPDSENHKGAEIDKSRYSVTYDASKGVMTVRVPDALACVLGYEERIDKSAVVEGYDVSNSVNLSGQWSSERTTKLKTSHPPLRQTDGMSRSAKSTATTIGRCYLKQLSR